MSKIYHARDIFFPGEYETLKEAFDKRKEREIVKKVKTPSGNYEIIVNTMKILWPDEHWEVTGMFNYHNAKNGIGGFSFSPYFKTYDLFCHGLEEILVKYDDHFEFEEAVQQSFW